MMLQEFSEEGIKLLIKEEGKVSHVYPDEKGLSTIGIGHLLTHVELGTDTIMINKVPVDYHAGLTDQQIFDLLQQDMFSVTQTVNRVVNVILTQNQFDALCLFAFNIGNTNFTKSTLLRLLNNSNFTSVPEQLRRWNKIKLPSGEYKVSRGLTSRREREINLWLKA